MNLAVKTLIVTGAVVFTAGCSLNPFGKEGYFREKSGDYAEEREAPALKIPADMNPRATAELMPIPAIPASNNIERDSTDVPLPQVTLRTDTNSYSIQTHDGVTKLITDRTPAQVWPVVMQFVENIGLPVTASNSQNHTLETGWMELESDKQGFLKRWFTSTPEEETRLHIELKPEAAGSAVSMNYARRPLNSRGEGSEWQGSGQGPTLVLLNELVAFMAGEEAVVTASAQDQALDLKALTQLAYEGSGAPVLKMKVPFVRSWAAVGSAMDKARIPVADRDRSAGVYYIKVNENIEIPVEDEEPGFWANLFGGGKKDKSQLKDEDGLMPLQVLLARAGDETQVVIQLDADHLAPDDVAEKLLKVIERNLD